MDRRCVVLGKGSSAYDYFGDRRDGDWVVGLNDMCAIGQFREVMDDCIVSIDENNGVWYDRLLEDPEFHEWVGVIHHRGALTKDQVVRTPFSSILCSSIKWSRRCVSLAIGLAASYNYRKAIFYGFGDKRYAYPWSNETLEDIIAEYPGMDYSSKYAYTASDEICRNQVKFIEELCELNGIEKL